MRKVQIYIEGQRLELFQDEKIQVTSSVQNVQDIAKVFTDYSQSFTVPASPHNNQIFQHFYENAIDGTIDHQIRRNASIEIDLIPFRTGKIQIEKSNLKKGQVESYTITFFGDIRTLQDYFGEDKLNSLDLTPYTHNYTGTEIKTRIESSSSYDIRWPLISSERYWVYGGGGQQDISQNSHHIHYDELFPAIRISKVFEAIETKYSIDFQGLFLNDKRFTNCYLWLKNRDKFNFISDKKILDFTSYTGSPSQFVDTVNNKINIGTYVNAYLRDLVNAGNNVKIRIYLSAYSVGATSTPLIDVYRNGQFYTSVTSASNTAPAIFSTDVPYQNGYNATFQFYGSANTTSNVQYFFGLTAIVNGSATDANGNFYYDHTATIANNSYTIDADFGSFFPDMKISDFMSGIIKQFNLTVTPITQTSFKVEPLEDWYTQGRIIDVTKHIDINSIDIERTKLYKKISFKHQKSETILNNSFSTINGREYGDFDSVFVYDGGEYTVEVPFENLLHNKFTNTDLQVGYSLDKNLDPVIPKPILLYMNEQKTCSFYFNDGSTTHHITQYMPFGQDLIYNNNEYTLNFGWDASSFTLDPEDNNIYTIYYNNYLSNLYSPKQRITYCKGIFPTSILTSLKMNDRLIIRDKRYIINEIKTDLNTGEVDLVLLHDFRLLDSVQPPAVPAGQNILQVPINFPNGVESVDIDTGTTGITTSTPTLNQPALVEFTFPIPDPAYTIIAENSDDLITESFNFYFRSEENNTIVYTINLDYNYTDGSTVTQPLNLTQIV